MLCFNSIHTSSLKEILKLVCITGKGEGKGEGEGEEEGEGGGLLDFSYVTIMLCV